MTLPTTSHSARRTSARCDYVQVAKGRSAGVPLIAVAQTYKQPFFFWYALKSANIATVADWKGKKVGQIQVGDYPERDAILLAAGLQLTDITPVQQDFGVDDFMAGKFPIAEGVVFYHPALINLIGVNKFPDDFVVFDPATLGGLLASQTIAGNDEYVNNPANAATIRCFLRASVRGWQFAFANAAKTVTDNMTFIPPGSPITEGHQAAALPDVLKIVGSGADDTTPAQDRPGPYVTTITTLSQLGLLTDTVNVTTTYNSSFYDAMGPVTAP